MERTILEIIRNVKSRIDLPASLDIRIVEDRTGVPVNRRRKVKPIGLGTFLDSVGKDKRVASFCNEFGQVLGAQVGAKVELHYAGQRIDGRKTIGSLQ